ncbi:GtrA family protein [Caldicellulosiruptor bescii]|nr:GtrA family protein [Caldicellulosiruptor bescii]
MNKKWTFENRTKGRIIILKVAKSAITNIISLLLSIVIIKLSRLYLSNSIIITKIFATLCAQVVNHILYKIWVITKMETNNESIHKNM